jgi:arginyl-tRNA synthetase
VIDVRQSYLQSIVGQAFRVIGESEAADSFTHFAYEMVALSPRTAEEIGIAAGAGDETRAFVEMSGRRGYGVKADDLMDLLEQRASDEVALRNPQLGAEERAEIGRQIAVGALRYFLLKYTRNTVIVFDLDEALSFEGETGPYVQYAAVRAHSIFEKLADRWGVDAEEMVRALERNAGDELPGGGKVVPLDTTQLRERLEDDEHGELWALVLALARFEEAARHAATSLELSGLAKYAFTLAQHFNRFYHRYPILQEEDPRERSLRVLVADLFRRQLATALDLLGIPLPDRM